MGLSLQQVLDTTELECEHLSRGYHYVTSKLITAERLKKLTVDQYACLRHCAKYVDNFNHEKKPALSLDQVLALEVQGAANLEDAYDPIANGLLTIEEVSVARRQRSRL